MITMLSDGEWGSLQVVIPLRNLLLHKRHSIIIYISAKKKKISEQSTIKVPKNYKFGSSIIKSI